MKRQNRKRRIKGQSIVEFALVLPLLVLLLVGMIEVGSIFYDYLTLAVANREGVRFSSRGRFEVADVAQRVIAAGGRRQVDAPYVNPYRLRSSGTDANFGMIITSYPFDEDGALERDDDGNLLVTTYVTGTIPSGDGTLRPITPDDSRIDKDEGELPGDLANFHGEVSARINEMREADDFEPQRTEIVIVETFLAHNMIIPGTDIIQFPDPMTVYFMSSMRVMRDRNTTVD